MRSMMLLTCVVYLYALLLGSAAPVAAHNTLAAHNTVEDSAVFYSHNLTSRFHLPTGLIPKPLTSDPESPDLSVYWVNNRSVCDAPNCVFPAVFNSASKTLPLGFTHLSRSPPMPLAA